MKELRGLTELVQDAVHHGSLAVEEVHQRVARTTFDVLALVPPLAAPAHWIAARQAEIIAATYETVRQTSAVVGRLVGACIDEADRRRHRRSAATTPPNAVAARSGPG